MSKRDGEGKEIGDHSRQVAWDKEEEELYALV